MVSWSKLAGEKQPVEPHANGNHADGDGGVDDDGLDAFEATDLVFGFHDSEVMW